MSSFFVLPPRSLRTHRFDPPGCFGPGKGKWATSGKNCGIDAILLTGRIQFVNAA
jgi:hypothetical protein